MISRSCLDLLFLHSLIFVSTAVVLRWVGHVVKYFQTNKQQEHPPLTVVICSQIYKQAVWLLNSKMHHVMNNERCAAEKRRKRLVYAQICKSFDTKYSSVSPSLKVLSSLSFLSRSWYFPPPPPVISLCFLGFCDWLVFAPTSAFILNVPFVRPRVWADLFDVGEKKWQKKKKNEKQQPTNGISM